MKIIGITLLFILVSALATVGAYRFWREQSDDQDDGWGTGV